MNRLLNLIIYNIRIGSFKPGGPIMSIDEYVYIL